MAPTVACRRSRWGKACMASGPHGPVARRWRSTRSKSWISAIEILFPTENPVATKLSLRPEGNRQEMLHMKLQLYILVWDEYFCITRTVQKVKKDRYNVSLLLTKHILQILKVGTVIAQTQPSSLHVGSSVSFLGFFTKGGTITDLQVLPSHGFNTQ